ncbi:MAG: amino acid permease, partial [Gemmatimonadota bacterium]|jgi:APA family basic amino acid/polyamine antiporter
VVYLLINVAFLVALTPAEMNGSPLVAEDAIRGVFGNAAGNIVVLAGMLILLSSINVNFLGMPRVAFGLARDRLAPAIFTRVGPRGTPTAALVFISLLILGLAVSGAFEFLIRFMMMVAITVDLVVLLGFFRLRWNRPDLERPMRVPAWPWLPALAVVLYLAVLAIIVWTQPSLALGAGAMLLVLITAGWITVRKGTPRPSV